MKLLIIGHARHGKDTVAKLLGQYFGLTYTDSSRAAAKIFIYDTLKDKYGYDSFSECYEDRVNHRAEWYNLIREYNESDKARLAKDILKETDIYSGMRDVEEIEESLKQKLFDFVIGVYDPRKPEEPKDSFNIDLWESSDFVIPNSGDLIDLERRVLKIMAHLKYAHDDFVMMDEYSFIGKN